MPDDVLNIVVESMERNTVCLWREINKKKIKKNWSVWEMLRLGILILSRIR